MVRIHPDKFYTTDGTGLHQGSLNYIRLQILFYPRHALRPMAEKVDMNFRKSAELEPGLCIFIKTSTQLYTKRCMNLHRKTLVLLHGHGMDDRIWDSVDATLNEYFTIVRPNISLFTFCQSVEEYADELHRYLTNATIQKFTLLGHSMGGYIALAFAEKYPDMLQGFGLIHSTAFADNETKKHQRNQTIEMLRQHGTQTFLKNTAANLFGDRYKELNPNGVKMHVEKYGNIPAEALSAGMTAMRNRPDRTAVLSSMPYPVLMIIGMMDNLIPFESCISLSEYPKQSYPFILAEAGHMGMIERPDAMSRMINWYMGKV